MPPKTETALPPAAEARRQEILAALKGNDFDTLKKHLIDDFTYGFGKEPSAKDGIEYLRKSPVMKKKLVTLLQGPGAFEEEMKRVIWPAEAADTEEAYLDYRAGLLEEEDWKLGFFIGGD